MYASESTSPQGIRQAQMLKLVTQSFCKELARYGANRGDIVTVSSLVLDYVVSNAAPAETLIRPPDVDLHAVGRLWRSTGQLAHEGLSLRPLGEASIPRIATWLAETDVQTTFTAPFPLGKVELAAYLLATPDRSYLDIFVEEKAVGIIGADDIDASSEKLEMKKFIGEREYRGKGIGKKATFLWLYYVLHLQHFNKVYLHTLDTNIRNINLNAQLGFELEGILFQDVYVDRAPRDVLRMSLLRDRWTSLFGSSISEEVEPLTTVCHQPRPPALPALPSPQQG